MSEIVNPYIAGAPVTAAKMFFGRDDIFDWIERSLAGQFVDHLLVVHGQRRVGKTSVLKQLAYRLPPRYIPVFFDLQGRTHTTLDRFLWWLAREIVRVLKQDRGIVLPAPEREAFAADPEFLETHFLPQLESLLADHTLLLTIDEFDTLEEPDVRATLARPLIDYLRRLMGRPQLTFIFSIGSAGRKLENMQAAYTEFFKAALYKKISFLEREQTHRLITRPVEGVLEYAPAAIARIYQITSGHPYFTQLVCYELFSRCQQTGQRQIAEADVTTVLDDVIERGTVNLKFVWDEAADLEKWALAGLAHLRGNAEPRALMDVLRRQHVHFGEKDLRSALLRLREKDVLTSDNRFVVYLMQAWLERNRPLERVQEELVQVNPIANRFIEIGQAYKDQGLPDKAIASFQQALAVDAANIQAQVGIAAVYLEQKNFERAAGEFEKALKLDEEDVAARAGLCDAHLALGDQAQARNRVRDAMRAYEQVLQINAEHTDARQRLADLDRQRAEQALTENRDEDALGAFEDALRLTPEDQTLIARLAQVRAQKKMKLVASFLARAEREQAAKRWEPAILALEEARKVAPDDPALPEKLATLRQAQRQERLTALLARAEKEQAAKNWAGAMALLVEATQVAPEDVTVQAKRIALQDAEHQAQLDALLARVQQARAAERWDDALAALQDYRARESNPAVEAELAQVRRERHASQLANARARARGMAKLERWDDALAAWQDYLALEPPDRAQAEAEIHLAAREREWAKVYAAAQSAIAGKNYDHAIQSLKSIVAQNEAYKDAMRLLAQAVELRGTTKPAWQNRWLWVGGGALGLALVAVLIFALAQFSAPAQSVSAPPTAMATPHASTLPATPIRAPVSAPSATPTVAPSPTQVPAPTPTAIPLAWTRVSSGAFLPRDSITALAVDPNDPGVWYVGTANAGIYKSLNAGASWQPAQNGLGRAGVRSLWIDPGNSQILYAGATLGGVFKSVDRGERWQAINQGLDLSAAGERTAILALNLKDRQQLYFTHGNAIFFTSDGGATWQTQNARLDCPREITNLVLHPTNPQTLFAATLGGGTCAGGVYKTNDGGKTWTPTALKVAGISWEQLKLDSQTGNYVYAAPNGELAGSTDGGNTWRQTGQKDCVALAVQPTNGATVYCASHTGAVSKSVDAGQTWQALRPVEMNGLALLTVLPQARNLLFAAGLGLAVSADDGATWSARNSGLGGAQIEFRADAKPGILYLEEGACADGGSRALSRSTDGGRVWSVIAKDGCGLAISADGATFYRRSVKPGEMFVSSDQGATWTPQVGASGNWSSLTTHPSRASTVYALAGRNQAAPLFVSEDRGKTWQAATGADDLRDARLFFDPAQGQRAYAIGDRAVFRSDDAGKTWVACAPQAALWFATTEARALVDPRTRERVFAATRGSGVVISADGCATWQSSNLGLGNRFVNALAFDPKNPDRLYAGTDSGAYISADGGKTWGGVNNGLLGALVIYSIAVDPKDASVYASTPYGIFKLENR